MPNEEIDLQQRLFNIENDELERLISKFLNYYDN